MVEFGTKFKILIAWSKRHALAIFLFGGFIFDNLTLRRTDRLFENLVLLTYLVVAIICIIVTNRAGVSERVRFWFQGAIQFCFGNLFSAFIVFYARSSSLEAIWPVLVLFVGLMIANEVFKKYYERLLLQLSMFYLCLFSFLAFFLPVLFKSLSVWLFIGSGVLSLVVMAGLLYILFRFAKDRFVPSRRHIIIAVIVIYAIVNLLYFTNLIPPIPLALKDGGIYHAAAKVGDAYELQDQKRAWRDWFTWHETFAVVPGGSLYIYSAIFSPADLNTTMVHDWQYYDPDAGWESIGKVTLPIIGGREQGYRAYSYQTVMPGLWRVDVATARGQVIGRIKFRVINVSTAPALVSLVK